MLMPTVRLHLLLMRCWRSYREKCRSRGHYSVRPGSETCCRRRQRRRRALVAASRRLDGDTETGGDAALPPKDGPTTDTDKRTGLDRRSATVSPPPSGARNLPGLADLSYVSALPAPRQAKCVAEINWPPRRLIRAECKEHLESEHRSTYRQTHRGAALHSAPAVGLIRAVCSVIDLALFYVCSRWRRVLFNDIMPHQDGHLERLMGGRRRRQAVSSAAGTAAPRRSGPSGRWMRRLATRLVTLPCPPRPAPLAPPSYIRLLLYPAIQALSITFAPPTSGPSSTVIPALPGFPRSSAPSRFSLLFSVPFPTFMHR